MERRALLDWLLDLIRDPRRAQPVLSATTGTGLEAIELVFRGKTFRIRVEEVAA